MTVVAEVITTGGISALIGLIFGWIWARITKMEKRHCTDLFDDGHQPRYVTVSHCEDVQEKFSGNFNELKTLLLDMDKRREEAKDLFIEGQRQIENRLIAIETKLEIA